MPYSSQSIFRTRNNYSRNSYSDELLAMPSLFGNILAYQPAKQHMPKPNKYNIKAIRNELENCIRYKAWNKFRSSFELLEFDLQTAVAKEQTGKSRQSSSPPLLCILLEGVKESSSPPNDLFELILKACPISSKNRNLNFYGNTNPISIAIDRHAPISIIELILKHDERKELLHRTNKQSRDQQPPILRVVRLVNDSLAYNKFGLLQLLVANDVTKESLLVPSPSKKKVALHYASNNCITSASSDENRDICVEEYLEFMLLQTQEAVEIQQGRRKPLSEPLTGNVGLNDDDYNIGFFSCSANASHSGSSNQLGQNTYNDDRVQDQSSKIRAMKLFRAMVTCAHLLERRKTIDLMQHLVYRTNDMTGVDDQGNSLLHYICRATETSVWLEPCLADDGWTTKRNLVQHFIAECPNILLQKNDDGDIPLHVAIRSGKTWELLHHLCPPANAAAVLSTPTKENQLPLHLAIEYSLHKYLLTDKQCISQLWKKYPESAAMMDGRHCLFPFQLVAAVRPMVRTTKFGGHRGRLTDQHLAPNKMFSMSNEPTKDSFFDLQLSYDLLRSAPEVLKHFK